ncbi:leucine--tRNA ligase [Patescibacteria group bacterium]|nr:leucine--tRNA ligase [Patescibacteria group bacterium]MDE1946590.1 leucine--tRNA ligase [Patescibacteria group bacterium]MDE2010847.1 leucine--tRNA ligase [Patescibacteria group bacterium]MDE2233217.1 leucine--tRNA ligase [Patescibacteria group bacterium]
MKKEQKYAPAKIEKKWQKKWAAAKIYKTKEGGKTGNKSSPQDKYYVLDMFPYPSGEGLHVGHPKGYIATDVVSRMKRMQGKNVLHPMGFDAFGLPAENYALKMKKNPMDLTAKNVKRFKDQLEILGFDYDWSREVNTTDPKYYKWTQWIFLQLFKKGLAYESFEPINWCPSCKTGLANEDIENGRCERCGTPVEKKPMRQWVLKITDYAERLLNDLDAKNNDGKPLLDWPESIKEAQRNWIGRSEGALIKFRFQGRTLEVEVFTTRPDTLFGVTYLVLAPEHKLVQELLADVENRKEVEEYVSKARLETEIERTDVKKEKTGVELKGIKAINPANNEEVPVWVADYVLADYGTGAVMAVPAHDERDWEFAKKFDLPIKDVVRHVWGNKLPNEEFRKSVCAIVRNKKDGKILLLKWKNGEKWISPVIGGVEDRESYEDAAVREVLEETGYKAKIVEPISFEIDSHFFATHKGIARHRTIKHFLLETNEDSHVGVSKKESEKHELFWTTLDDAISCITHSDNKIGLQGIKSGNYSYIGEGVLVNSGQFNGKNSEEVKKEITDFVGGKWVTKYKLRDWVFSRQRYWGEPIPIIHCGKCGVVPVPEKDLPVKLPKVKSYEPTGTGESPLAAIKNWVNVKCSKCKGPAKRETNTMPQWAGSSWYYLRYEDPKNAKKLVDPNKEKYWSPVDLYVGGAEHATRHLIYARFWHKFLYDIGVVSAIEPFKKLQNVGLIMGEDGRKMSKRFGNVVNPDDIVNAYGADTMRIYEMFMGPFDQQISWSTSSMVGARRFIERVWKLRKHTASEEGEAPTGRVDKILHKTIKKVTKDIDDLKFNTAVSSLMIAANELEKVKSISREQFEILLKLLAPFIPHVADELWTGFGNKRSIHVSGWPVCDEKLSAEEKVTIAVQVNGKTRGSFEALIDIPDDELKNKALSLPEIKKWIDGKVLKKTIVVKNKLVSLVASDLS